MLAAIISSCSGYKSFQPWSQQEIITESAYMASSYMDYRDARTTIEQGGQELNNIVGNDVDKLGYYFLSTRLFHIWSTHFLEPYDRGRFQMFTLGASIATVYWNWRIKY
jgi:hypothetical protein